MDTFPFGNDYTPINPYIPAPKREKARFLRLFWSLIPISLTSMLRTRRGTYVQTRPPQAPCNDAPSDQGFQKKAAASLSTTRGVHHSLLWCWNYMGGNPPWEPDRVFLQILPKDRHFCPNFDGKRKYPPQSVSIFPELMFQPLAEKVGFEPTGPAKGLPDFESGPL